MGRYIEVFSQDDKAVLINSSHIVAIGNGFDSILIEMSNGEVYKCRDAVTLKEFAKYLQSLKEGN